MRIKIIDGTTGKEIKDATIKTRLTMNVQVFHKDFLAFMSDYDYANDMEIVINLQKMPAEHFE